MGNFVKKRIIENIDVYEFLEDVTSEDIRHIHELFHCSNDTYDANFIEATRYISAAARNVATSMIVNTAKSNKDNFSETQFVEDALSEVTLRALKYVPPKFADINNPFLTNTGNFISYLEKCAKSAVNATLSQYGIVKNPNYSNIPGAERYIKPVSIHPLQANTDDTDGNSPDEGFLSKKEFAVEEDSSENLIKSEQVSVLVKSINTLLGFEKEAPYKTLSTFFSIIIFPFMKKTTKSVGNFTPVFRKYKDSKLYEMRDDLYEDIGCLFRIHIGCEIDTDKEITFKNLDCRLEKDVPKKFHISEYVSEGQKYKDTLFGVFTKKEKDMYDWAKSSMKKIHDALYKQVKDYL